MYSFRVQNGPFTTAPGKRRKLLCWEIWAEDGKVMMADRETGELHALSCGTAAGRLKVFAEELRVLDLQRTYEVNPRTKASLNDQFRHRSMLVEYLNETLKEAVEQGDQDNVDVQKQKIRQFYRSRGPNEGGQSVDALMAALFGS